MKMHMRHWQDVMSVLVGLWLIASPWALGLDAHTSLPAFGTFVVIGIALVACSVTEFFIHESWEEYSELYLAVWLIASPWVQEYKTLTVARDNAVACGLLVLVMAVWVLATDNEFGWRRRRVTH